jgi:hypothetical protein
MVLSRSTVRCRHGVDPLGRAAGGDVSALPEALVAEAAELTGRADVALAHPAPAMVSNAIAAATARCPLTRISSFREPLRRAPLVCTDAATVPCVGGT